MKMEELVRRIERAKMIGKTRTADETARIVKLPKNLVWGALMGGEYFTQALKRCEIAALEE